MKIEIKKLILCAAVSLILLPAEEVLGAEQMVSVMTVSYTHLTLPTTSRV